MKESLAKWPTPTDDYGVFKQSFEDCYLTRCFSPATFRPIGIVNDPDGFPDDSCVAAGGGSAFQGTLSVIGLPLPFDAKGEVDVDGVFKNGGGVGGKGGGAI